MKSAVALAIHFTPKFSSLAGAGGREGEARRWELGSRGGEREMVTTGLGQQWDGDGIHLLILSSSNPLQ